MEEPMEVLVAAVVILAVVVPVTLTQIWARQQLDLALTCSRAEALEVVTGYFGPVWTEVSGPGTFNYRPKLRMHAPTISIMVESSGIAGCRVSVWISHYKTKYGCMYHAGLMARKKRGIGKRFAPAIAAPAIA
jgi:hypothetical protein